MTKIEKASTFSRRTLLQAGGALVVSVGMPIGLDTVLGIDQARAQGARPPATATAAPDEDPPAIRGVAGSRGFLGVPKCGLSPSAEKANSERLVLPRATIPAAARLATIGASVSLGAESA